MVLAVDQDTLKKIAIVKNPEDVKSVEPVPGFVAEDIKVPMVSYANVVHSKTKHNAIESIHKESSYKLMS